MTQQLDLDSGYADSGYALLLGVINRSKKYYRQNRALLNYCSCRDRMSVSKLLFAGPLSPSERDSSVLFGQFNRSNIALIEDDEKMSSYTFDQCYEISTDQSRMSLA